MFQTLRTKFGIPGVISVIALVFAMAGGAFAANNLAGSGDSGATASAKAKQGPRGKTGKTGPQGPAGPAGAPGAKGDTGAAGANGTNGAPGAAGAAGASVTSTAVPTGVATCGGRGGSEFKAGAAVTTACNGKEGVAGADGPAGPEGSPWTAGGTLPAGSTETGVFTAGPVAVGAAARAPISFSIPLASDVTAYVLPLPESAPEAEEEAAEDACPGSTEEPIASPGFLCVYERNTFGVELASLQNPETGIAKEEPREVGKVGGVLTYVGTAPNGSTRGVWAVTAPAAPAP